MVAIECPLESKGIDEKDARICDFLVALGLERRVDCVSTELWQVVCLDMTALPKP